MALPGRRRGRPAGAAATGLLLCLGHGAWRAACGRAEEEVRDAEAPVAGGGRGLQALELRPGSMLRQRGGAAASLLEVGARPLGPDHRAALSEAKDRAVVPLGDETNHAATQLHLTTLSDEANRIAQVLGETDMMRTAKHMSDAVHGSRQVAALMNEYKDDLIKLHKGGVGLQENLLAFHRGVGKDVAKALRHADFESLESDLAAYYERQNGREGAPVHEKIQGGGFIHAGVGDEPRTDLATNHGLHHETLASGLDGFQANTRSHVSPRPAT